MSIFSYPLVWPSLSQELAPFLQYCKGIVLNAGSGKRDIQLGQRDLGIDIDPNNNPDIIADLHRLPLRDESVDTIVSIAVLEHTRYAWIVAQEFYRVLRAGGFGVIAVPFLQPQHACPHDFVRFTCNGLTELMEYVGFEVVETKSAHHFGQTLAWLLWEYLQVNKPWKITWPFWYHLINQLSKGRLLGKDSPNTHNVEYVIVCKPGDCSSQQHYYLEALSKLDSPKWFFPLLSCPQSRQPLHYEGDCLISADGRFSYSFKDGKPYLFPGEGEFRIQVNPSENFALQSLEPQGNKFSQKLDQSRKEAKPIEPSQVKHLSRRYEVNNILSQKNFVVNFKSYLKNIFSQSNPAKVAVLATTEYEGIFQNGGVGTYYKNLAKTLASDGWYLILLICNSDNCMINDLNPPFEVNHIFLTSEINQSLNFQPIHLSILAEVQQNRFDYQSYCCLFFMQAILNHFPNSRIYVEFHEMSGIGYHSIQAKRLNLLPSKCVIGVTLHSGHEWIYEANDKYTHDHLDSLWQVCYYEQHCFENADIAFFPSDYLKTRVESYGWRTDSATHLPNYIPVIEYSTNKADKIAEHIQGK